MIKTFKKVHLIRVIFFGTSYFADKATGAQVLGGRDPTKGSVPEYKVPPQIPWQTGPENSAKK